MGNTTDFSLPVSYNGIAYPFKFTGKSFFLDPINGSDSNDGTSPAGAFKTLAVAYAALTNNSNDVLYIIGGATGNALTSALNWAKSYTHCIGLSADLPGLGQRVRVTGSASVDLTQLVTVSGSGNYFRNIQFFNGADANVDSGAVYVTGSRNVFENCFFAGMGHATPAARAGSYSLKVTGGSENAFYNCTIGLTTITRAAANADLVIGAASMRNKFINCEITSFSDTAGHFAVSIGEINSWIQFQDCLFFNESSNNATSLTDAISLSVTQTTYVILRGNCQFVGYTGVSDTVAKVYGAGPAPNAGMFLSTNPTT